MDNLALYNTKTKEVVSRFLNSDTVDYHLYKKNKVKLSYLKVIKNPSNDILTIKESGALTFKNGFNPVFLGLNY